MEMVWRWEVEGVVSVSCPSLQVSRTETVMAVQELAVVLAQGQVLGQVLGSVKEAAVGLEESWQVVIEAR